MLAVLAFGHPCSANTAAKSPIIGMPIPPIPIPIIGMLMGPIPIPARTAFKTLSNTLSKAFKGILELLRFAGLACVAHSMDAYQFSVHFAHYCNAEEAGRGEVNRDPSKIKIDLA